MKALLLTHPEQDRGEEMLFCGLCEVLGDENVVDAPTKLALRGGIDRYRCYYHGLDSNAPWGFVGGLGNPTASGSFPYTPTRPVIDRSRDEVFDLIRSDAFDFVIVGPRFESLRHFRMIEHELRTPRIVFHDAEDYADIAPPHVGNLSRVKLYLKREFLSSWAARSWPFQVKPFPFSCAINAPAPVTKSTDVSLVAGHTHPDRHFAFEAALSLENVLVDCPTMGVFGTSVPESIRANPAAHVDAKWSDADCRLYNWQEYVDSIARARIGIAPRGHGFDSVRRWETPAFDTLLFAQRLDMIDPYPLVDGEHCVVYSSRDELVQKLRWWLANPDELRRVALAGQTFVREHHSCAARARQLIQHVKDVYS